MKTKYFSPALIILFFISINIFAQHPPKSNQKAEKPENKDSLNNVFKQNIDFLADHLPKGGRAVIQNYLRKYQRSDCCLLTYKNSTLKAGFEPAVSVKGIRKGTAADRVFVMPAFNTRDEGDSYCFYNLSLPPLRTESFCCHPKSLFVLDDIDEDGVREIGIYFSSCASRFKALRIYSLKKGKWKFITDSTFDTFMKDPSKTKFETLVKKTGKGKFKICDFEDGFTKWQTAVIK